MLNAQKTPAPNTGVKHKKRHWIVCEDCRQRKRVAHPGAKYCSKSCAKRAQLIRKKERESAEQARIEAEALQREQHIAEVRQRREKARQERVWLETQKDAQNRANLQAEENRRAIEQDRINRTVIVPCECGNAMWIFYPEEKPLFGKIKPAHLECNKCDKQTITAIAAKPCPHCQATYCYINRYGERKCRACGVRF